MKIISGFVWIIIYLLILNCKGGESMPVESINTSVEVITYIASNLIILIAIVSILTYLFLKGYDLVIKNHSK